ncbi:hypothetical protein [Aurantivibrio plasticivorans]
MRAAKISDSVADHEIVSGFADIGLPLCQPLCAMLNESAEHCRPRRGCGYTQASRFIAQVANRPRQLSRGHSLDLFSEAGRKCLSPILLSAQRILGRAPVDMHELESIFEGLDSEDEAKQSLKLLSDSLLAVRNQCVLEESRVLLDICLSLLGAKLPTFESHVSLTEVNLSIGTCPEAERYFFEFAGGHVRRSGSFNIIVNSEDEPIAVEKVNIGDSHSCITLRPITLNDIILPPGSLVGVSYNDLPHSVVKCEQTKGLWIPYSLCSGFRFLRLTTLAISPINRARAFTTHLERQLQDNPFFDPLNTTLDDLRYMAEKQRSI